MPFSAPISIFNSGYFNPGTLNLRGWWRGDYVPGPWLGEPAATIPVQIESAANAPSVGTAVNGFTPADFNGANDELTYSTHFLNTLLSSEKYYYAAVINPRNPVGDGGGTANEVIFADDNLNLGLSYSDVGVTAFQYDTTTGWVEVDVACSANNWHYVQVWHDGTNLNCQVDTTVGTPVAVPMTWLTTYIDGMVPKWGTSTAFNWYDGEMLAFTMAHDSFTTAIRDGMGSYFQNRYALSFGITAVSINPENVSLTGLWMDSYSGSPWIGSQNAVTGISGSGYNAVVPAAGTAQNGYIPADFNGTDDQLLSAQQLSDFIDNASGSCWALFNADAAAASAGAGSRVGDAGIVCQDTGATCWGLSYSTDGACVFIYDSVDFVYKELVETAATGSYHLAQFKWNGTTLYFRINSNTWQTITCAGLAANTGGLVLGKNYSVNYFNGRIIDVGITDQVLTDIHFNNIKSYINGRYGLSL